MCYQPIMPMRMVARLPENISIKISQIMILIKKRQSKLDSRRRFLYYSPLLIFSALGRI
jgi:hypothetical protein